MYKSNKKQQYIIDESSSKYLSISVSNLDNKNKDYKDNNKDNNKSNDDYEVIVISNNASVAL